MRVMCHHQYLPSYLFACWIAGGRCEGIRAGKVVLVVSFDRRWPMRTDQQLAQFPAGLKYDTSLAEEHVMQISTKIGMGGAGFAIGFMSCEWVGFGVYISNIR
jgi:hypothetical protein